MIRIKNDKNDTKTNNKNNNNTLNNDSLSTDNIDVKDFNEKLFEKEHCFLNVFESDKLSISILKYLEFDEMNNLKFLNKKINNKIIRDLKKNCVKLGSLSRKCRNKFWLNNVNMNNIKIIVKRELDYHMKNQNNEQNKEFINNQKNDNNDHIKNIKSTECKFNLDTDNSYINNKNTYDSNTCKTNLESNLESDYIFLYKQILIISEPKRFETIGLDKKGRPIKTNFSKSVEEISKDLNRTFHQGIFDKEESFKSLDNILSSISFIRPEIGYCQGMNFVAGALFEILQDEIIAFWIFLYFLDKYELNQLYYENMPDYSIRIFQLEHYMKIYLKDLYFHFKKQQINPDLILSKWILTLFCNYIPFNYLSKIFDNFILNGWSAIIKFCLVFLDQLQKHFLKMDLNLISKFMRDNSKQLHTNFNLVLDQIDNFEVNNLDLDELRANYFRQLVYNKMNLNEEHWDLDQLEALNIYSEQFKTLEEQSKPSINMYKEKFEYYSNLYKTARNSYIIVRNRLDDLKSKLEVYFEKKVALDKAIIILNDEIKNSKKVLPETKKSLKTSKERNKEYTNIISELNKKIIAEVINYFHFSTNYLMLKRQII